MAGPLPDIKMRAQVQLPARIDDGVAIRWTRESGKYRADLDWSDINELDSVPPEEASDTKLPVWNRTTKQFTMVPFTPSNFVIYGTSSTSNSIGTGSKSFTTQADISWLVGTRVRASDNASPKTNWMEGVITSYDGNALTVDMELTGGSGTVSNWNIAIAAQPVEDAADVDFTPSYTGAVSDTVVKGLSRRVYAADFGVMGANDPADTAKIQKFLDYIGGAPYKKGDFTGRTGNQFTVNDSLIYQSNTTIEGNGGNMRLTAAMNKSVFKSSGGTTENRSGLVLRDFVIDCSSASTYTNSVGVDLRNVSKAWLENVYIYNAGVGVQMYADTVDLSCYYNHIISSYAGDCGTGYYIGARANENTLMMSNSNQCNIGVTDYANDTKIAFNSFEASVIASVRVQADSVGCIIAFNRMESNTGTLLDIVSGATNTRRVLNYFEGTATRESDLGTGTSAYLGALIGKATIDFGTVNANSFVKSSLVSSGPLGAAAAGDVAHCSTLSTIPDGVILFPMVDAGGVKIKAMNVTTSNITVGSITVNIVVHKASS